PYSWGARIHRVECRKRCSQNSEIVILDCRPGMPVEEIAQLARHSSSRTTEVVYRHELRPVLSAEAEAMANSFKATERELTLVRTDTSSNLAVSGFPVYSASQAADHLPDPALAHPPLGPGGEQRPRHRGRPGSRSGRETQARSGRS